MKHQLQFSEVHKVTCSRSAKEMSRSLFETLPAKN